MKKILLVFLLILSGQFSFGQQTKLTNTLLWRISGKQLTKPSYLYGTMHLTDKRVFQLGDSVYKALEQTEGFAGELDMNSIGMQMVNQFIKESEEKASKEPVKVKDVVSEEIWSLYKNKLAEKFNKKAEKITVDELDAIEKKFQNDMFKKGDMPTFLDAWLFGQARKQGKWVGGLEEMEDQLEQTATLSTSIEDKIQLALFDDKYYGAGLENFIKTYTNQQLDSIDAYMYREANGTKDYIMIKRNLKMARRIDSLSAIRTTLFAVGAAHLPGDSGVVALLRSRGYTVTPVISSKKMSADKYISKAVAAESFAVDIEDSSYSLRMPGVAQGLEMFTKLGLDMKMFFDISQMKMYMTFGIEISEKRKEISKDSMYQKFKDQYTEKGKLLGEKKISVNGTDGREYRISTTDGEMKMQVFLPAMERVILNAVFAFKDASLVDNETEKFFQSFTYNYNQTKTNVKEDLVWKRTAYPLQSFSIEVPVSLKETKDAASEEGKTIYSWQGIDMKGAVFYGMRATLMNKGMYDANDDTTYFISVKENLKNNLANSKVGDSIFCMINNYPGYKFMLNGTTDGNLMEINVTMVNRGGIGYYLYTVHEPGEAAKTASQRFLNSFQLLPYTQPDWKIYTSEDKLFSALSPVSFVKSKHVENYIHPNSERYVMYDSLAAVTTYIDKSVLPSWYWHSSDTAFLRKRSEQYLAYSDSLADYKVFKTGNQHGVSFTVMKPGNHLVKKVQLILNGDELFEIFGYYAGYDMKNLFYRFYDGFKVLNEKKDASITRKKMNELSATLKNADKETAKEIKLWSDMFEFTKTDIPALQKLLLKIYPDFDSTYYDNLNSKLFDKVEELDSNNTTVDFIKNNYAAIAPNDEYIKPFVISYLSGVLTAESYSILKNCLLKYPLAVGKSIYYSHALNDSLALTATLYPELLQLAGKETIWEMVCETTVALLDDSLITKALIKEYAKNFIESSKRILTNDKEKVEDEGYTYTNLIRILGIINTPESNGQLVKFSKFNNQEIRFRTLIALLGNNQPVDAKTIYSLASTDEYRHDLYDELKKINKLKLFPPNYLSQKELAKSKLYEYASDDDPPQIITEVGTRTILYKGKQQKFYLFKVSFSDDGSDPYLGVAGPYAINPKDFTSTHDVTGLYWDVAFDPKLLDKQLKEYLASLEEYENDVEAEAPPSKN